MWNAVIAKVRHEQQIISMLTIEIEIKIEIVYNTYRMRRLLSLGPPNNAIRETYKSGLNR
jgi:hypothetical protein